MRAFYARKDDHGNYQDLSEHLENVAGFAAGFAGEYANTARLAGLLHDMGKASRVFQAYLESERGVRGSVVHALQGALYLSDMGAGEPLSCLARDILQMVISAHHGELPDAVDLEGDRVFFDKMAAQNEEKYHYNEVAGNFENGDRSGLFKASVAEIKQFLTVCCNITQAASRHISRRACLSNTCIPA